MRSRINKDAQPVRPRIANDRYLFAKWDGDTGSQNGDCEPEDPEKDEADERVESDDRNPGADSKGKDWKKAAFLDRCREKFEAKVADQRFLLANEKD